MNSENLSEKNLVRSAFVPLLGGGLVLPVCAGGRPADNALLGVFAIALVALATFLIAAFAPRAARNFRIGLALLITGGVFSVGTIVAAALPVHAAVATLAPLLIAVGALAAENPAYADKGGTTRAIVDGAAIGLCFAVAAAALGAAGAFFAKSICCPADQLQYRSLPAAFLLVAAVLFVIEVARKRKRSTP